MKKVLVDSNVILDILTQDENWCEWSKNALDDLDVDHELLINPVIYSEISIGFEHREELDAVIKEMEFRYEELDRDILFIAGKAFVKYRRNGGQRSSPLPDFFIGAHAQLKEYKLITRDKQRFQSYFNIPEIIAPR